MRRQYNGHFARGALATLLGLLPTVLAGAQSIVITSMKADGVYTIGETIEWRVELREAGDVKQGSYVLKKGGLTVMKEGTLEFTDGAATLQTALDEPGTLLAEVKAKVGGKDIKALAGAVAAPDQIKPSSPCPDDFDAFWNSKVEELNAIPANPNVEPADGGKPSVDYFKVRLDNIRGSHVYGQLAKPKREGKFPALLLVQYAGVYPLPKENVTRRAEAGWLVLNIMAHDLPFDRDADFYKQAGATTLKDYVAIGAEDRDKSYFLRMYLGCYRAADYLAGRPDWDGKTLVVMGTSQGGQQSIITAGLCPKITAMLANVPGGCDSTGPLVGRAGGFPYWVNNGKWRKHEAEFTETGRYYDAVNFAARVKCPAMVSLGLIDETCPPAGVLAAANRITSPKEVLILPKSNHHGDGNAQAAFFSGSEKWLREIQKGNSALPPDLKK